MPAFGLEEDSWDSVMLLVIHGILCDRVRVGFRVLLTPAFRPVMDFAMYAATGFMLDSDTEFTHWPSLLDNFAPSSD